jgi:hypothetical protein
VAEAVNWLERKYVCVKRCCNTWTLRGDLTHPRLRFPIPQNLFHSLLPVLHNPEATDLLHSGPQHLNLGPELLVLDRDRRKHLELGLEQRDHTCQIDLDSVGFAPARNGDDKGHWER